VNWRSSLLGAIVVIAAGAIVGIAVGRKSTTRVRTTTVVRTVKVVTKATATTPTTATPSSGAGATTTTGTGTNTTPSPGASGAGSERYLAEYLESVGGIDAINNNARNASMVDNPNQQELGGQVYQHATAFGVSAQGENESASVQIPTPGFARFSSPAVGLETTVNANAVYRLTIYKNDDSSPHSTVLYQDTFQGPSTIRKVSFALQGATDILLVWTHKTAEPDNEDTFVLADPVLIGP
jgi:hypothetical protein